MSDTFSDTFLASSVALCFEDSALNWDAMDETADGGFSLLDDEGSRTAESPTFPFDILRRVRRWVRGGLGCGLVRCLCFLIGGLFVGSYSAPR